MHIKYTFFVCVFVLFIMASFNSVCAVVSSFISCLLVALSLSRPLSLLSALFFYDSNIEFKIIYKPWKIIEIQSVHSIFGRDKTQTDWITINTRTRSGARKRAHHWWQTERYGYTLYSCSSAYRLGGVVVIAFIGRYKQELSGKITQVRTMYVCAWVCRM